MPQFTNFRIFRFFSPAIHIPSPGYQFFNKKRCFKNRRFLKINIFDLNRFLTINSAPGPQESESAWKLLQITRIYVEFGATRACFVTKQGQETINRKIRKREHRNRRGNVNAFL